MHLKGGLSSNAYTETTFKMNLLTASINRRNDYSKENLISVFFKTDLKIVNLSFNTWFMASLTNV